MSKIQVLSPELINQIAAGEVVERPASVVKELVENAIDAGADQIEITASDAGRKLRIADNGYGMNEEDLKLAFRNHATSKVKTLEDLFNIKTLGFRGEALASIAAIARVTCISRTSDSNTGLKATVKPTGEVILTETGCAVGTIMEVQDLFYNVPARLKFLKRPQTELSHIQETIQMLALSNSEISFLLKLEDSTAVKTSGSGNIGKTISEVFSMDSRESLIPFELADEVYGYRVWGQTSSPNTTRSSKKWIMTFVNGRAVRCPILSKAIEGAYQSLIPSGKFPVTVLFLELPSEEVDVNVHPTKKEVKYSKANTLYSFARKAVEQALTIQNNFKHELNNKSLPPVIYARESMKESPLINSGYLSKETYPIKKEIDWIKSNKISTPDYYKAVIDMYAPEDADNKTGFLTESINIQLPGFKIIGQLAKTYILVETDEGLLVIDQHIASERVLFESLSDQATLSESVSQKLLIPLVLSISPVMSALLSENRPVLEQLGFEYDLAEHTVCFTAVPSLYDEKTFKTAFERLISHFEETEDIRLSADNMIATMACHSAVRAGDVLNPEQMQRIIAQWFDCKRPWTCPHGRQVSYLISHKDIMKFFERPSLPLSLL